MTFTGLDNNYYLTNNPIYLEIFGGFGAGENFLLFINVGGRIIGVQMFNEYAIIDLAPVIKSLMALPNFQNPNSNRLKVDIGITWYSESQGFFKDFNDKVFIRGGRHTGFNNILSNNTILKVSDLIPVWGGLPASKYTITGTTISETNIIPDNEKETMQSNSCEGAYLMFLNSLGGYSFYLFDTFTINDKSKSQDVINRFSTTKPQNNFYSMGSENSISLDVESRFDKRHFGLLRSLVESNEIWVYQFHKLINSDFVFSAANDWTKLNNPGNQISIDAEEDTTDASLSFDFNLTKDNRLV